MYGEPDQECFSREMRLGRLEILLDPVLEKNGVKFGN
jgi:hypothetical protein